MAIFYAWLLYLFVTLTYWWYWLILLIVLAYWFCSYHDCPAHFDIYVHTVVYLVVLVIDSFACILSWSSLSMLFLSLFILIVTACMWTWVIYLYFAWLCVAWLLSSVWLHVACPCGPHTYPLISDPLVFGHFFHSGSHFCKSEALCVFASPTELDDGSRV